MAVNPSTQRCSALLLDLDDTLYDVPAMKAQVAENIQRFMVAKLGVPEAEVTDLCFRCYIEYGTTMAGLVAMGYTIDADEWHAAVHHTLPYESFLRRDPELLALLEAVPVPMHIFTNADRVHAVRCLKLLGISHCFDSVVAFEDIQEAAAARGWVHHGRPVVCKPGHQAYQLALELTGLEPSATAWFDDSTRNIAAGKKIGMYSVLVGRTGVQGTDADAQLLRFHDLPAVLPWLLKGTGPEPAVASSPSAGTTRGASTCSSEVGPGVNFDPAAQPQSPKAVVCQA